MSTARHTYAGDVGTGTTTDNMQSRVKSWMMGSGTTNVAYNTFNVSSLIDNAVGSHSPTFTALFAVSTPCVVLGVGHGAAFHMDVVSSSVSTHIVYSWSATHVLADCTYIYESCMGILA